jgi:RNA polymerase sigma-70 factor (TIGR02943 family)
MELFANELAALRPALVRVAHQRLRNDAWAEDAVSETLLAALENPSAFAGRAKLRTWLVGIQKHKLVDQARRGTRERPFDTWDDEGGVDEMSGDSPSALFGATTGSGDPQDWLSRRQWLTQLDACLQALPLQQRHAFVLRHGVGEETEDICDQLGVTAGNLAVILHRARKRLRESFAQLELVP